MNLKKKKQQIKSNRKEINTTFNDPTETDRQIIDIDNQISKEKLGQLDQQKRDREKKLNIQKQQLMNECKEVVVEIYKICKRIGVIRNSREMSLMMGKGDSYYRLYEGNFINQIRYSTLNELKDNLYSLKMGINAIMESDNSLPPKEWILDKVNSLMSRVNELQYKLMKLEFES